MQGRASSYREQPGRAGRSAWLAQSSCTLLQLPRQSGHRLQRPVLAPAASLTPTPSHHQLLWIVHFLLYSSPVYEFCTSTIGFYNQIRHTHIILSKPSWPLGHPQTQPCSGPPWGPLQRWEPPHRGPPIPTRLDLASLGLLSGAGCWFPAIFADQTFITAQPPAACRNGSPLWFQLWIRQLCFLPGYLCTCCSCSHRLLGPSTAGLCLFCSQLYLVPSARFLRCLVHLGE